MNRLEELKNNQDIFFNFMKEKYHIYLNSNIFFRDIQYAINSYFEKKDITLKSREAENLTSEFTKYLEEKGDLTRLNYNSFRVNFSLEQEESSEQLEEIEKEKSSEEAKQN